MRQGSVVLVLMSLFVAVCTAQEIVFKDKPAALVPCTDRPVQIVKGERLPCEDVTFSAEQTDGSDASARVEHEELKQQMKDAVTANQNIVIVAKYLVDKDRNHADLPDIVLKAKHALDDLCRRVKCEEKNKKASGQNPSRK